MSRARRVGQGDRGTHDLDFFAGWGPGLVEIETEHGTRIQIRNYRDRPKRFRRTPGSVESAQRSDDGSWVPFRRAEDLSVGTPTRLWDQMLGGSYWQTSRITRITVLHAACEHMIGDDDQRPCGAKTLGRSTRRCVRCRLDPQRHERHPDSPVPGRAWLARVLDRVTQAWAGRPTDLRRLRWRIRWAVMGWRGARRG